MHNLRKMDLMDLPSHLVSCLLREWLDGLSIGLLDSAFCSKAKRPLWLSYLQNDGKFCKNITRPRNDQHDEVPLDPTLVPWLEKRNVLPLHLIVVNGDHNSPDLCTWIESCHRYVDCDYIELRHVDNDSDQQALMLMKRFPNRLKSLIVISDCFSKEIFMQQILETQSDITELDIFNLFYEYELDFTKYFPNLEKMSLVFEELDENDEDYNDMIEERVAKIVPFTHHNLKVLSIGEFRWNILSQTMMKRFPNVTSLDVDDWVTSHELRELLYTCPKITSICVIDVETVIDEFTNAYVFHFPQITQLFYCRKIEKLGDVDILRKIFPNLVSLESKKSFHNSYTLQKLI